WGKDRAGQYPGPGDDVHRPAAFRVAATRISGGRLVKDDATSPRGSRVSRALVGLAWLNVLVHVLALILALVGMRPGSPLVELPQRLAYLARSPLGWSLGWGTWMFCTLALIAFFAVLARHLPEHGEVARLAVILAVAGGILDLFCDVVYIV